MSNDRYWIGVDLGGTWVRVVLSNAEGDFLQRSNEETDVGSPEAISKQIVRIARLLCSRQGLDSKAVNGVGIASAGPMIQKKGELTNPPNLPFEHVPLTKPVSEGLGAKTFLINDCAAAALAETRFGAARGIENFVYVTLSTGVGCGAIVNGTLLMGKDGNAHEVGHFVIDYEGKLICGCGRRGHWEAYCSGRNMPNYVRMRLKEMPQQAARESLLFKNSGRDYSELTSADLFDFAKKLDDLSLKLVEEIGVLNAMGFANVINAYDPSLITVGGAVALNNKKLILDPIRRHVKEYALNRVPRIIATPLGEDIGVYGAVAAALKFISQF